jgi:hypothetical protein
MDRPNGLWRVEIILFLIGHCGLSKPGETKTPFMVDTKKGEFIG